MANMGNANANLLSLITAPAKMAIPIMGLKLSGYMNTLDNAATIIKITAMINVDVLCLFIFNMLCAKISNAQHPVDNNFSTGV